MRIKAKYFLPISLIIGIILLACVLMQRLTSKLPIPSLLIFMFLGKNKEFKEYDLKYKAKNTI